MLTILTTSLKQLHFRVIAQCRVANPEEHSKTVSWNATMASVSSIRPRDQGFCGHFRCCVKCRNDWLTADKCSKCARVSMPAASDRTVYYKWCPRYKDPLEYIEIPIRSQLWRHSSILLLKTSFETYVFSQIRASIVDASVTP